MKRWISLCLLLVPLIASAASFWDGNAALQRGDATFEGGMFAASNSFPQDTQISIVNLDTGKSATATITKQIDGQPDILVLLSPMTASALGISQGTLARVRVTITARPPSAPTAVQRRADDQHGSRPQSRSRLWQCEPRGLQSDQPCPADRSLCRGSCGHHNRARDTACQHFSGDDAGSTGESDAKHRGHDAAGRPSTSAGGNEPFARGGAWYDDTRSAIAAGRRRRRPQPLSNRRPVRQHRLRLSPLSTPQQPRLPPTLKMPRSLPLRKAACLRSRYSSLLGKTRSSLTRSLRRRPPRPQRQRRRRPHRRPARRLRPRGRLRSPQSTASPASCLPHRSRSRSPSRTQLHPRNRSRWRSSAPHRLPPRRLGRRPLPLHSLRPNLSLRPRLPQRRHLRRRT